MDSWEAQGSSEDDSKVVCGTPEILSSLVQLNEALNSFSKLKVVESPVSCELGSQLEAKHPLQSRLNVISKPRNLFPAKAQENFP